MWSGSSQQSLDRSKNASSYQGEFEKSLNAESLTQFQLQQLREAWLLEYKQHENLKLSDRDKLDRILSLETDLQESLSKIRSYEPIVKLGEAIAHQCKNPFPIVAKVASLLAEELHLGPTFSSVSIIPISVTCMIKSGDSWMVVSSESARDDILKVKATNKSFQYITGDYSNGFRIENNPHEYFPDEILGLIYGKSKDRAFSAGKASPLALFCPFQGNGPQAVEPLRCCWVFTITKRAVNMNIGNIAFNQMVSLFLGGSGDVSISEGRDAASFDWPALLRTASHSLMLALIEIVQARESSRLALRDCLYRAISLCLEKKARRFKRQSNLF